MWAEQPQHLPVLRPYYGKRNHNPGGPGAVCSSHYYSQKKGRGKRGSPATEEIVRGCSIR